MAVMLFVMLSGACSPSPDDSGFLEDPASTPGTTDAPSEDATRVSEREAERPGTPSVVRGGCPFECCTYGNWEALTRIKVHPAERDQSDVAFTLEPGTRFAAVTGNVHIIRPGLAVTSDTLTLPGPSETPALELAAGDTVEVLAPYGEGTFGMRRGGTSTIGEGFWAPMTLSGRPAAGHLVRAPEIEWWVEVRTEDGRSGWIEMDRAGEAVRGADACA